MRRALLRRQCGTTYRVAVDGAFSPGLGSALMGEYFLELWMPPANDNFRDAQQLPSEATSLFSEITLGATRQVGDPRPAGMEEPGSTIWFNWTAPAAGAVSLDTCGSDFDTFLGVYAGSALGALTQVAVNDNGPGPGSFRADEPGSKFRCKLDGHRFKACSSPKTYKKLKPGRHTFQVAAVDAAGNVDRTPAVAHFVIPKPS